jgi:replicative DNA helicase
MDIDLAILKTLTKNKKHAVEFVNELDSKIFLPTYIQYADLIISYIKLFKEVPTFRVLEERLANQPVKLATLNKYWDKMESQEYDEREFKHDIDVIKKRFEKSVLISLKEKLENIEPGELDPVREMKVLKDTINRVQSINAEKSFSSTTVRSYLSTFWNKFQERRKNPEIFEKDKIRTGLSVLDAATNGGMGRHAEYMLICGETNAGKSQVMLSMAVNSWLNGNVIFDDPENNITATPRDELKPGNNIIFFSLEEPMEPQFFRFISNLSNVEYFKIESGKTSQEEFRRVKKTLDFIKDYPYQFKIVDFPRKMKASDMEAIIAETLDEFTPDLIVNDYIGVMDTNESSAGIADWLKMDIISREFRDVLRVFNVSGISGMQLNRMSAKDVDQLIGLHRLARSSQVASHATIIVQIVSRGDKERMLPDMPYAIIKNRHGAKVDGKLIKHFACSKVLDDPSHKYTGSFSETTVSAADISEEMEDIEL